MVFIMLIGLIGLLQLKTTFFPEQENRTITINTIFPGASPAEMEEGVTSKIEENLVGIKGVKRTFSVSSESSCFIFSLVAAHSTIVFCEPKNVVLQSRESLSQEVKKLFFLTIA